MNKMNESNTGILPPCTVALAMKKPLEEEETLLEGGTIETRDVELKDTFVCLMSTIFFFLIAMAICLVI